MELLALHFHLHELDKIINSPPFMRVGGSPFDQLGKVSDLYPYCALEL